MYDTVKGGDFSRIRMPPKFLPRMPQGRVRTGAHGRSFNRTAQGTIAQRAFGGHTGDFGKRAVKRACHAADRTGRVILDTLYGEALRKGIKVYQEFHLLDLITRDNRIAGVLAYELGTGEVHSLQGKAVLLATGGFERFFRPHPTALRTPATASSWLTRQGSLLRTWSLSSFTPRASTAWGCS